MNPRAEGAHFLASLDSTTTALLACQVLLFVWLFVKMLFIFISKTENHTVAQVIQAKIKSGELMESASILITCQTLLLMWIVGRLVQAQYPHLLGSRKDFVRKPNSNPQLPDSGKSGQRPQQKALGGTINEKLKVRAYV